MKRMTKLLVMLLMLSLLVTGCSSPAEPSGSEAEAETSEPAATETASEPAEKVMKDTVTIAHWQEPATLDPQYSNMISWFLVETQVFNGLVDYDDAKGEYVPVLAESWEMIDDTHMQFKLKEGVMFQNGEELTANDVYFTFKLQDIGY
jgi:peptide/nickel transport system substrate-binding protein